MQTYTHTTCTHTHTHTHFQAFTCGDPLTPQHPENQVAQGAGGEGRGRAESRHCQLPKCPGHRVRTSRAGAAEGQQWKVLTFQIQIQGPSQQIPPDSTRISCSAVHCISIPLKPRFISIHFNSTQSKSGSPLTNLHSVQEAAPPVRGPRHAPQTRCRPPACLRSRLPAGAQLAGSPRRPQSRRARLGLLHGRQSSLPALHRCHPLHRHLQTSEPFTPQQGFSAPAKHDPLSLQQSS